MLYYLIYYYPNAVIIYNGSIEDVLVPKTI